MQSDAVSSLLSGFQAALTRQQNSGHNIANLNTEGYSALDTVQVAEPGGGTRAITRETGQQTDLVEELIEQKRAEAQALTSARALDRAARIEGSLLDVLA